MRWIMALLAILLVGCGSGSSVSAHQSATSSIAISANTSAQLSDQASGAAIEIGPISLTAGRATAVFSNNPSVKPASPAVTPIFETTLTLEGEIKPGQVTLNYPLGNLDPDGVVGFLIQEDGTWITNPVEIKNQKITTTFSVALADRSRGLIPKPLLHIGLLVLPYKTDVTEQTVSLYKLAGQGVATALPQSGKIVIVVHGMNNNMFKMFDLASQLVKEGVADSVYGLEYIWQNPIESNARAFAALLNTLPEGQKVTVIAHSMGGLVTSQAIEQEGAYKHVETLLLLGTPRQGTKVADDKQFKQAQMTECLNDPLDIKTNWFGYSALENVDTLSTRQMIPNSPFLNTLNGTVKSNNSRANYVVMAGSKDSWQMLVGRALHLIYYPNQDFDGLVAATSLLEFPYERVTLGSVTRLPLKPYNHAELIQKPEAIIDIVNALIDARNNHVPKLDIALGNNGIAQTKGWDWTLTISNQLIQPITINQLMIASFNRNGVWSVTDWYNSNTPSGQFFPNTPTNWNQDLNRNGSINIRFRSLYNDEQSTYEQALPEQRAQSVVVACTGTLSTGQPFSTQLSFDLKDMNGIGPAAHPRSVVIPTSRSPKPSTLLAQ